MSSSESDAIEVGLTFIVMGGSFFYSGFKKRKLVRKIQDIATSKIKSAVIGDYVELKVKVYSENNLKSPIGLSHCAAYIIELQRFYETKNSSGWTTLSTYYSTPFLFVSDEGSHVAAVELSQCELLEEELVNNHTFRSDNLESESPVLQEILSRDKKFSGSIKLLSEKRHRVVVNHFHKGSELYILGSSYSRDKLFKHTIQKKEFFMRNWTKKKNILNEALLKHLKSMDNLSSYDKNNNKKIDKEELNELKDDIFNNPFELKKMLTQSSFYKKVKIVMSSTKFSTLIFKTNKVYISRVSEERLIAKKNKHSLLQIWGGPLLLTLGIWLIYNEIVH